MVATNRVFALILAALASWPTEAGADVFIQDFKATVAEQDVTYEADVCSDSGATATSWGVYYDLQSAPAANAVPDAQNAVNALVCDGNQTSRKIVRKGAPVGLYRSYARVDLQGTAGGPTGNDEAGPIQVCVGPDLVLKSFEVGSTGAAVTYFASVCNEGSMPALKFRVGFWHDQQGAPAASDMGDIFEAIVALPAGECTDVQVAGGLRPNGSFVAWSRADSGDFVTECREGNNARGPTPYSLSNPDLYVKSFGATVQDRTVNYRVEVCNQGTAAVAKFFVDVYYHRTDRIPMPGDPGDQVKAVSGLDPGGCTEVTFTRSATPDGDYHSWALVDADDFISEPDEGNNLSQMLLVKVGAGGTPPDAGPGADGPGTGGECIDADNDGYGVGPGCQGVPDCDDTDPMINPGMPEICDDGIDQDCDLTPDDGCPGVDCNDGDGDSFGVGADCVLADCDDSDKDVHPWAPEKCGDNKDDNCNGIADDGCVGRQCVDRDADGYGVGAGCPGPQDCDDGNFFIHPGAGEICGDGIDNDCDGVPDDGCSLAADKDGDGATVGGRAVGLPPPVGKLWQCVLQAEGASEMVICTGESRIDPSVADPGWTCTAMEQSRHWTCRRARSATRATGQPDCDDSDPNIYPGAKEICGDGIDNDCDGTVDDGCPGVDCIDMDGDGWGVGADCAVQDCRDDDAKIHPWAEEVCGDGIDNDCDGTVDDGCPGVDCVDMDGDSWGVGKDCSRADCDDTDASISPWAKEICSDSKDNNCDRAIDEGCPTCEDRDGDGHGIGPKCHSWDCDDDDPTVYPGAEEICDGKDNNCDGIIPEWEKDCGEQQQGCDCAAASGGAGPLSALLLALVLLALSRRGRRRPGPRIRGGRSGPVREQPDH